jgi:hypothetical protein
MMKRTQKLKWILARAHLIEAKLVPIRYTVQCRDTQAKYTNEDLERINAILKDALKEIDRLKVRRWNRGKI